MRTKTLLLAAALSAAGLATSMAQSNVYSVNIVGYVNKVSPPGGKYVQWGNPLKTDPALGNSVTNLFLQAPAQSQFLKWGGSAWNLISTKLGGAGSTLWSVNLSVANGEGGFFRSPVASVNPYTNTFVGEVIQSPSTNSFNGAPGGIFNLISDLYPVADNANASGLSAALTPGAFTQIHKWNEVSQGWVPSTMIAPATWAPSLPSWEVGESFFLRSAAPGNWIR